MGRSVDVVNLQIEERDNYKHIFEVYSDVDKTVPAVLNGYTAKMEFRDAPGGQVFFSANAANGYLTIVGSSVVLEIPTNIVDAWTFESAFYDIFVISSLGKPKKIIRGTVTNFTSITEV